MTIELPIDVVRAVLDAETRLQIDAAIEALRSAYMAAVGVAAGTDEWSDLDPSELPRF